MNNKNNKMANRCIIHYPNQSKYSKLKTLSDTNKEKINKAKELRLRLGGDNHHEDQCAGIPEDFDDAIHGIHYEPCYKK